MAKHAMNTQELRQRMLNLRSIRDGLKASTTVAASPIAEAKLYRIKLSLTEELQDVRTIYYVRKKMDQLQREIEDLLEPRW